MGLTTVHARPGAALNLARSPAAYPNWIPGSRPANRPTGTHEGTGAPKSHCPGVPFSRTGVPARVTAGSLSEFPRAAPIGRVTRQSPTQTQLENVTLHELGGGPVTAKRWPSPACSTPRMLLGVCA